MRQAQGKLKPSTRDCFTSQAHSVMSHFASTLNHESLVAEVHFSDGTVDKESFERHYKDMPYKAKNDSEAWHQSVPTNHYIGFFDDNPMTKQKIIKGYAQWLDALSSKDIFVEKIVWH